MREPKLRLLMMIMKCLVLGCMIDNKGGGMRILNVNNGNHDRSTDTPSGDQFLHQISQLFPRTTFKDFPQINTTHTYTGDKLQCVREYSLIIASSSFRLRLYLVRAGDCS